MPRGSPLDLLIGKGAQIGMGARNEMTPLMLAARTGDAEIVALLLEAGEWLAEAEGHPEKGRIIKSKAGFARVKEVKDVFNKGVGKNQSAPVARFRKKPVVTR